jgi:hypothetical protein
MTRRSAFAVAGGVVAALGAGILATFVNVGVLNASDPQGPGQLKAEKPVVRTITQTKTIHKKAKGSSSASGGVVFRSGPGTSTTSRSTTDAEAAYDDDSYESEEEDGYEDESEDGSDDGEESEDGSEDEEHEFDESDDD